MSSSTDQQTDASAPLDISAADVVAYLKKHPNLVAENKALLEVLELPQNTGASTSLVERQVSVLRERGIESRRKLSELIEIGKTNDQLFSKTAALVIAMIDSEELNTLFELTEKMLIEHFDIDFARIAIISNSEDATACLGEKSFLVDVKASEMIGPLLEQRKAIQSSLRENESGFIFGNGKKVGSAYINVQTVSNKKSDRRLMLAMGHSNANVFTAGNDTMFADFIYQVLSKLSKKLIDDNHLQ